jgi:hypothetical protein
MLPSLSPPEVLRRKLVAQCGEMQNLAVENDQLAASHAAGDAGAARTRPHMVMRAGAADALVLRGGGDGRGGCVGADVRTLALPFALVS